MKHFVLAVCLMLSALTAAPALAQEGKGDSRRQKPSFEQFMADKTRFLMAEMQLPAADSAKFVPLYRQMMKAKGQLMRKYRPQRGLARRHKSGEAIPDSVYQKAVFDDITLRIEDAKLEQEYLHKFAKVLTPKQLYSYQLAEKRFIDKLARQPRREEPRK